MKLDKSLPYLLPGIAPIGGRIKEKPEDFVVDEEPLFLPSGEGEHLYVSITKKNMTTMRLLQKLSYSLNIPEKNIGYSGLKDRCAITTQVVSIQNCVESEILKCDIPGATINWAKKHRHKLRPGQLRGNRFKIVLRGLAIADRDLLVELFEMAVKKGFPNYFGSQRFGFRHDSHLVGGAFLRGQHEKVVNLLLGKPGRFEPESIQRARSAFESGDYRAAEELFRPGHSLERKLLKYLVRAGPKFAGAVQRVPRVTKRFLISAYQSDLFNRALAERIKADGLTDLWPGDVAMKHDNGASFTVVDAALEIDRLKRFEISPTGPIFGKKMLRCNGQEGFIEEKILKDEGLCFEDFHKVFPGLKLSGGRRSYRIKVQDLNWELQGNDLRIEFFLPKGTYATTFLREIVKPECLED